MKLYWKGRELEKVKEFKYLGYVVKSNRNQEEHIRDRVKKGAALLGQVWGKYGKKEIWKRLRKENLAV